jgi:hypothetical protein
MYQIYHTWIQPLHHSPLSPYPIPGIVSTGLIFPFTYMCTQYLRHIHPPTLFPHILPLLLVPPSPGRTWPSLLFSNFVKEKKWHFCLFNIATQGVFLWHFHVDMYYNLYWFTFSIFLLSTLVHYLWCFQQLSKFCIQSYIGSASTIFTF